MSGTIEPAGDRVFVVQDEAPEKTEGGILRTKADQEAERPLAGVVSAVGPDVQHIEKGDRVVFTGYAGTPQEVLGKNYMVMREEEILCRIT